MEYRRVEDYQYRPETLKILYAIRVRDVVRMKNSIREGDYISFPVMKLSYSPEQEMAVNRRLRVLRKYPYIMELWDAVSKKKRYISYKDYMLFRLRGRTDEEDQM